MKLIKVVHKAPMRVARISKRRQQIRLRRAMVALKCALEQEKQETKEMLEIYKRYTLGKADRTELKTANAQLVDILKGLGLGVFAILPFAPITIPIIVKVGSLVGVDVLPSSFNLKKKPTDTKNS
ncbi:hypothetical protein HUZ36_21160 [Pseudoalteromonas sp. McH1-7]|uniref:Letm1 RBD domain-containing protein n=1 Tax=Pseudoalteromonas peptidolytica F12-50-A1 TaxID=1315280 RepID=A0A8I0N0H0_9GAMM|nr:MULTISPECIES: hypothetical protein [Pseudoalteromonas]MBE0348475.1 hypothetical protein [Pseudoalteromonas peptidolytica F12-50-A1]MDW7551367.1 hypothetical protein [Pseudoalteromonas peptidolytica]NLR16719.1 hypothetical protein [Pseudoalteromonas peptidolytica]NUZ13284.1 hypothetical protein [Pseudoalteromonas sp. McH1-7]RRS08194.1 hypothetical protein EAG18_12885 [Pseudoalteromonas sp. J010]